MSDAPGPDRQQLAATWSPVAAGYDESFAPYTGGYAEEALRLVGLAADAQVLDVAAGSGALTLRAARLGAWVTATDFAEGMVEYLQQQADREGLDRVRTAVMDGQALELTDDVFDLTASMFGVIFFPDIDRGLSEMARVTRPGGTVCVSTWDLSGFRLVDLVQQSFAQAQPGFTAPTDPPPWARIGDPDGLAAALAGAGLDPVEVHVVTQPWTWADPATFFRRMPEWSPPVQPLFAAMDPTTIEAAAAAFADLVTEGAAGGGSIDVSALIGIGTKP